MASKSFNLIKIIIVLFFTNLQSNKVHSLFYAGGLVFKQIETPVRTINPPEIQVSFDLNFQPLYKQIKETQQLSEAYTALCNSILNSYEYHKNQSNIIEQNSTT